MRLVLETVTWWLASTAAYLLLVPSPTGLEVPVGFAVGAVCAVVGVAARRAFRPPTHIPSFVRRAVALPLDLLADVFTLTRMVLTGEAFGEDVGDEDEVVLPDDDETRAWAVLLTSASPGSIAADVEEREGSLVLRRHALTPRHRASDGWDLG